MSNAREINSRYDDLAEKIVKLVNDARDQCANELAALLPADGED